MLNFLAKLKNILLHEKEIICVSSCGIKSRKVGCIFLFWNVLLVVWVGFASIKYFELNSEIALKEDKITELIADKQKLLSNIVLLEKDIDNIQTFIVSLNKYDRFSDVDSESLFKNNAQCGDNIELVLNKVNKNLNNINLALIDRINGLESVREKLNFDNIQKVSFNQDIDKYESNNTNEIQDSIVIKKNLENNIDYLNDLEKFINSMPFSEPIASNYISSGFGKRIDPFIKTVREHHGVDFVGSYMAKIHAPADGKVIFVGTKGGYGNTIVIEHENDMRTLYGHLNSFNVRVGEHVKRGEIIGVQGNTGKSTGHHLHYEIIHGNDRYDPVEFIKIGSNFY